VIFKKDLKRRGGCLGSGDFAGVPFFVFLNRYDANFGLHVVVTGSAELTASELEIRCAGCGKLHPLDRATGNSVLVKPERWNIKRMDHISRTEEDMNGLTDRDDEFGGSEVILSCGVGWVDAKFIF
jgi:hypothetical protein